MPQVYKMLGYFIAGLIRVKYHASNCFLYIFSVQHNRNDMFFFQTLQLFCRNSLSFKQKKAVKPPSQNIIHHRILIPGYYNVQAVPIFFTFRIHGIRKTIKILPADTGGYKTQLPAAP